MTLPINANAVWLAGTSQAPCRLHSPITANDDWWLVVAGVV